MQSLKTVSGGRPILELIDAEKKAEAILLPWGEDCSWKLGDNIAMLPVVGAIRRTYPNLKVSIGSNVPEVYAHDRQVHAIWQMDEVAFDDMVAESKNTLLWGVPGPYLFSLQQRLKDFGSRGNCVIRWTDTSSRLWVGEESHTADHKNPLFSERKPNYPTYVRALFHEIGLKTERAPKLPILPDESEDAERALRSLGFSDRGEALRVYFNNSCGPEAAERLGPEEAASALRSICSEKVEVLVHPGLGRDERDEYSALVASLGDSPGGKVILPEKAFEMRKFLAVLGRFDLVVTTNTGAMHAASAVEGPLVLASSNDPITLTSRSSEGSRCLPYIRGPGNLAQGFDAGRLLLGGRGDDVFEDKAALKPAMTRYLERLSGLDPVQSFECAVDREAAEHDYHELIGGLKPGYSGFFASFDPTLADFKDPLWWHKHQQSPMYRFCALINQRKELDKSLPRPLNLTA